MELLQKINLFLKPEKCEFEKTEVKYLGVIISQNSIKMDPVKVAGVTEWLIPSNRKEVQYFLGFTNFYHRFIQGFSHLAHPLFDLTWKDTEWRWGAEEQLAFDSLKEQITTAPILALPDNLLSSEFGQRCRVRSRARRWLQLVGCAALLLDALNFGGPDGVGESGVEPRRSLRRRERVKEK